MKGLAAVLIGFLIFIPYAFAEEGKVYTEEDLKKIKTAPLTDGGTVKQKEKEIEQYKKEKGSTKKSEQKRENRSLLKDCLDDAEDAYKKEWGDYCEDHGLKRNCGLTSSVISGLKRRRDERREECHKLYN